MIGGDGDMLSIGGNHLIHALRRNVSLKIIMFNNQIYGLTKGQYSPTSEVGKITKSSPFGSLDTPFNPVSVALAAEATFVSRTHDMDRPGMLEAFRRAHEHEGSAFVEIYQNCNVFNDGAFEGITAKEVRADMLIQLRHGEPIRFGTDNERGVILNVFGECEIVEVADVGEDRLLVHDETREDPALAFAAVAAVVVTDDADADGRVPLDQPTDLRGRGAASAGQRGRASGAGRPRQAHGHRRHLDRQLTASRVVQAAEHHAGTGLGREERRLLRHAEVGGRGGANRVDGDRAQQHGGVGRALVDLRGNGRGVVAVGESDAWDRGADTGVEAGGVDVAQLRGYLGHARVELGGGQEQREPGAVDQTETATLTHGDLERGDPFGHVGTGGVYPERSRECGA